ncbi:ubiquitin carboxyl-terminal hydrolase uchl3 [Cystoisospora suis]|uniref:ubiquitinyl hydrolase 1 n=1 Tax=Cystoisospora suis TaxID=483139 RepID=A0A2C6KXG9_9APIC|nr:ubiquitin carboxyl-terminal hydrolase uchl3 [Cystoisospora suis]
MYTSTPSVLWRFLDSFSVIFESLFFFLRVVQLFLFTLSWDSLLFSLFTVLFFKMSSTGEEASAHTSERRGGKWLPLEANPMVFAQYVNEIGGSVSFGVEQGDEVERKHEGRNEAVLSFEDILSFEDWALEMLRHPTVAVLLLYPITKETEEIRKKQAQEEDKDKQTEDGDGKKSSLWYTKQTVGNACGTIALLHCLANLPRDRFPLQPGGFLEKFLEETANLTPEERAKKLETDNALASAHKSYETKGQSSVPTPERSDVDTHFVAFVYDEKTGCLYELDGRKNRPINHGPVLSGTEERGAQKKQLEDVQGLPLLRKAMDVIKKEFVEKSPPGELRFQLIAVESARS